mmetsp:Transcript_39507/g.60308  ORF Transcript_39507/g.60308 Transcript_39507/m.60308 type:complete len:127 (-) Transcript_39507:28-408(-)
MDDKSKTTEIRSALEDAQVDHGEGKKPGTHKEKKVSMSKTEVLAAQKALQNISLDQIKELKTMPPAAVQDEVRFLQPKLSDLLFLQIGVETEDLEFHTGELNLGEDKEFCALVDEYNEKVNLLQKA